MTIFEIPEILWLKLTLNASTPALTMAFNLFSEWIAGPRVAIILAFFPWNEQVIITLFFNKSKKNELMMMFF